MKEALKNTIRLARDDKSVDEVLKPVCAAWNEDPNTPLSLRAAECFDLLVWDRYQEVWKHLCPNAPTFHGYLHKDIMRSSQFIADLNVFIIFCIEPKPKPNYPNKIILELVSNESYQGNPLMDALPVATTEDAYELLVSYIKKLPERFPRFEKLLNQT